MLKLIRHVSEPIKIDDNTDITFSGEKIIKYERESKTYFRYSSPP